MPYAVLVAGNLLYNGAITMLNRTRNPAGIATTQTIAPYHSDEPCSLEGKVSNEICPYRAPPFCLPAADMKAFALEQSANTFFLLIIPLSTLRKNGSETVSFCS
jgi:hypothetical protein